MQFYAFPIESFFVRGPLYNFAFPITWFTQLCFAECLFLVELTVACGDSLEVIAARCRKLRYRIRVACAWVYRGTSERDQRDEALKPSEPLV